MFTVIPELQTLENQLAGEKARGSYFFWTQVSPSKSNPALAYSLPCYCSLAPFEPYGMARVPSPGHARQNEHTPSIPFFFNCRHRCIYHKFDSICRKNVQYLYLQINLLKTRLKDLSNDINYVS